MINDIDAERISLHQDQYVCLCIRPINFEFGFHVDWLHIFCNFHKNLFLSLCLSHVDMNFGTEKSSLNFHLSIPKNLRRTKHKRKFSFELIRLYKNISTLYASTSSRFFMTFKNHLRMMIESLSGGQAMSRVTTMSGIIFVLPKFNFQFQLLPPETLPIPSSSSLIYYFLIVFFSGRVECESYI